MRFATYTCRPHLALKIFPARCSGHHIERGVGLSGRCFAVVSNPRVLVRLLPCQANRGGGIQRGSSCDRLLPFDWHPRVLVMGVAPLAASHRGHFKSIARQEDCAGGTLRPGREFGSIVAAEAKSYDSRVT